MADSYPYGTPDGFRGHGAGGPRGSGPDLRPGGMHRLDDRQRRWMLLAGLALLVLVIAALAWNNSGTRDARRDLRSATQHILDKRNEVEEARQVLEQRLAELREAEAAAVAESERLDAELVRERSGRALGGASGTAAGTLAPPLTAEQRAMETLRRLDSTNANANPDANVTAPPVRRP